MKEAILDISTIQSRSKGIHATAIFLILLGFTGIYAGMERWIPRWGFGITFGCWLLAFHLLTSKKGIEFKIRNQKMRFYSTLCGIRLGDWKSIQKYPYVALIEQRKQQDQGTIGGQIKLAGDTAPFDLIYKVVIISKSEKHRITLVRFEDRKDAIAWLKDLMRRTGKSIHPNHSLMEEKIELPAEAS